MKDLTLAQAILIIAGIWLAYSFIRDMVKIFFKTKKPKFNKEYEAIIFGSKSNYSYSRDQLEKVKVFGRKYIAVYLKDGTCIEYEGFCFIVKTYKIKIDPIVQKS